MDKLSLRTALEMVTAGSQARVPEVLRAEAVARHAEARPWSANEEIQGYGIGRRVTEGKRLDRLALKVYVDRKKPKEALGGKMVPPKIEMAGLGGDIETDVEEIGVISLEAYTRRIRPAMPGSGLGHVAISAGTFGCLVRKEGDSKTLYILSNSHVLANSGQGQAGDVILQPGTADGGHAPDDVIAELSEFIPFDFTSRYNNLVDAAIAKVLRKKDVEAKFRILGIVPSGVGVPRIGTRVKKVGRTSDYTLGEVLDTDFRTAIKYRVQGEGRVAGFSEQVLCTRYTEPGDSGSAILHEKSNKLLGLHFAGSEGVSIFNKIHNVTSALAIEIVTSDV